MTRRDDPARAPGLTAKEWGLILTALTAYQHHAAYRALQDKIAPFAKAKGVPLLVASAPPAPEDEGNDRNRANRAR